MCAGLISTKLNSFLVPSMMSSSGGREQLHIAQRERGGKTKKVNVRL